jgi:hypothetical protein
LRELFGDNYKLENIATVTMQLQVNINELNQIEKMQTKMGSGMHGGGRNGGMGRDGMGNELQRGENGEMHGSESSGESQGRMHAGFSMERKSFSKDFLLSNGK